MAAIDPDFPYSLTISIPFPTHRLADSALRVLQVDTELSAFVRRAFSLAKPEPTPQVPAEGSTTATNGVAAQPSAQGGVEQAKEDEQDKEYLTVLRTEYKATTNRMLRVAVNSFMDSLAVVLNVMEELDVDVLAAELGR